MRIHLTLVSALLLFGGLAQAQVRKYSNEFLAIGVGANHLSQSGAVVAGVSGLDAGYWNPAGLVGLETREVGLMHASYFAGIANYDYVGGAMPLGDGKAVALSFLRFGVDNILNTSELIDASGNVDYDRISLFSAADYALILSYAQPFKDRFRLGANVKLIYRNIGDFANSIGFGFDLGAQTDLGPWKFGAVLRDATTTFNAWFINAKEFEEVFAETGNELPENGLELTAPRLQFGGQRSFDLSPSIGLKSEINLTSTFDGERNEVISAGFVSLSPALGLEADYEDFVFLRLGFGNFQTYEEITGKQVTGFQPNIGLGLVYKSIQVDYALTDIGDQSTALYSNIFSVKFAF